MEAYHFSMIKTQIQIPEELYGELKNLAKRKQWSLAETLRRAGESFLQQYPSTYRGSKEWHPPVSEQAGWMGLDADALKEAAMDDGFALDESPRPMG